MVHLDIRKLRNFKEEGIRDCSTGNRHKSANKVAGSQCMQVAADDHSRYASVRIKKDETAESVTEHLIETYLQYAACGIVIKRVLTDNGSGYKSKQFKEAYETLKVKHVFSQPYLLQTNGKAERFIQTLLGEWAYARTYRDNVRKDLDKSVLVDLCGLPERMLDDLELLRRKWCSEPSVHGGKGTNPKNLQQKFHDNDIKNGTDSIKSL